MRLLQVGDNESLTFTQDHADDDIPRYAILSHTWGKSINEVGYQDILDGSAITKDGFQKIRFCAEQAQKDGLEHIWVDTCCINKADSTELSAAINSMFKWYQKARICYVYLPDVSQKGREGDASNEEHLESQLRSSRWFTRGWTLQELIAPKHVVFYSRNWTRIGDKGSLQHLLCEITGIPGTALQGAALEDFSITERLSWQENRQTSTSEDKAYALFGICGVNLPLIYNEGQENAFRRLRDEIDNISKGPRWEDFAVTYAVDDVIGVEHFVARQSELREMRRVLKGDGSRRTVVIHGLGGMGKTQLMIAFAKRYRNDYSAIFWLNAKDNESLKASFANIAKQILRQHPSASSIVDLKHPDSFRDRTADGHEASLRLSGKDAAGRGYCENKADSIVDGVKAWLSLPGNTRWLMLFDNLDNPKIPGNPDANAVKIREFVPSAQHGFVAITTRSSRLDVGHQIELEKLQSGEDSLKILCDSSTRNISLEDPAALRLLERLDGLPLALATAGAYLRQSSMALAEYLELYGNAWARLQQTSPGLLTYEDRTLYSTWQVSFDQVNRINYLSANLLCLWAYFDNQDVWYELLCHDEDQMKKQLDRDETYRRPEWVVNLIKDKLTFEQAVRVLRDHGLVQNHSSQLELIESAGYSIHTCVHSWTRTVLNPYGITDLAIFALKSVAVHGPYGLIDKRFFLKARRLLRHASYTAHGPLDKYPAGLAWAFWRVGHGLLRVLEGEMTTPVLLLERAWHEADVTATDMDLWSFVAESLGLAYVLHGDLSKADQLAQLTLQRSEKTYGPRHLTVLRSMDSIAMLHSRRGQYADAKDLYLRLLQAMEERCGSDDVLTLRAVANCGKMYTRLGELAVAEHFLQRALQGLHKTCGPAHPDTQRATFHLAALLSEKGEYGVAEDMFLKLLVARKSVYGSHHPYVLTIELTLGEFYSKQQRWKESEEMFIRGLKGAESVYGVNGRLTLTLAVRLLGMLYMEQSRFVDAENMYLRAMQGLECLFGPDHRDTANAMCDLARFYLDQARLQEAEKIFLQALSAYEAAFGSNDNKTLRQPVYFLARTYLKLGKTEDARRMYLRALRGLELELGQYHKDIMGLTNQLGLVYCKLGNFEEAEKLFLQVVKGKEFAYGSDDAATLGVPLWNLCLLYVEQSRVEEAKALYPRLLSLRSAMSAEEQQSVDSVGDEIVRLREKNADDNLGERSAKGELSDDVEAPQAIATNTVPLHNNDKGLNHATARSTPLPSDAGRTRSPKDQNNPLRSERKKPTHKSKIPILTHRTKSGLNGCGQEPQSLQAEQQAEPKPADRSVTPENSPRTVSKLPRVSPHQWRGQEEG